MAERIRMIVDTTDTVRRAVQLRRVKLGGKESLSDIVNAILEEALAEEIAEIQRFDAPGEAKEKKTKRKGGD
jgi:hypothetical protein